VASEPKVQSVQIKTTQQNVPYPKVLSLSVQYITPPQIQAIHFAHTPLATNYPQVQGVRLQQIGPTYWLNGQVVGDLFTPGGGSIVQNDSVFTWFID